MTGCRERPVTRQIAPYCGDGIVEQAFGEECDGGSNCKDCRYIND